MAEEQCEGATIFSFVNRVALESAASSERVVELARARVLSLNETHKPEAGARRD